MRAACRSRDSRLHPSRLLFLKAQSESVPPTWLLVPGGTAFPAPQGLLLHPDTLVELLVGEMPSLSCGGASLHLALRDGVRGLRLA